MLEASAPGHGGNFLSLKGGRRGPGARFTVCMSPGQRGYVPAGKLELYHGTPSEEKLGEQAQPPDNSRHLTPEPTPAPVPAVPTRTQVSLGVEWGLASPQPPGVGL